MRQLAKYATLDNGNPSYFGYGVNPANDSLWDADMLHGCYCDQYAWSGKERRTKLQSYTGYDCSRRECPAGDDPKTRDANHSSFEVQQVSCWALRGTYSLSFRGKTTRTLPHNATLDVVRDALESLPNLGRVEVSQRMFWMTYASAIACSHPGGHCSMRPADSSRSPGPFSVGVCS